MNPIPELAQILRRLIISFKNSEFYFVRENSDTTFLFLREPFRRNHELFCIALKVNEGYAVATTYPTHFPSNEMLAFIQSGFGYWSIRAETALPNMPIEPTEDLSSPPMKRYDCEENVVRSVFVEAIKVLQVGKELEKQGIYFSSKWTPSVMKKIWVYDGGKVVPITKKELYARIRKLYDEYAIDSIKFHVNQSTSLAEITLSVPTEEVFQERKERFTRKWMKKRKLPSAEDFAAFIKALA